ncbi:hypothetical protein IZ6_11300 [Terrihabitans soli]|uniref:DUF2865 domain-containing protein n=1 Tax=Terrihabitans soli TaxID=708113 RepID=A0A6S6QRN1_9HYPH|nr:DUF2865 domain-containing protein [Terrihabitans soli]BCJ90395.1 hypothetical protein IZ6_11300 [Terrihabitans soli]
MNNSILALALGALALSASGAAAQYDAPPPYSPPPSQYSPPPQYGAPPAPQPQSNPACLQLEAQLAQFDAQGADPQQAQLEAAYSQQRAQMDQMTARSRAAGCGRNFLFGPRDPTCRGLEDQIDRIRDQVKRLESQLNRGRGGANAREGQRRGLIAALARNQCGAQYQAAVPQQQERGGLFGLLFGNRGGGGGGGYQQDYPAQVPQTSTFRTVCVRTCDGFFFPVSFTTVPARFGQDDNICRRTCPGAEAILFSYPNPGGTIEQATSTSGQAYTSLPNAFKYQTEFVKDCSCKPAGQTWEQALSGAEDDTLQSGDIVVDEESARAMSQPGLRKGGEAVATPDQAARAAQDSATQVINEGVVEGPANTDPPIGYPDPAQAQNPGTQNNPAQNNPNERTAVPYYVPQPQQQRQPVYSPPVMR